MNSSCSGDENPLGSGENTHVETKTLAKFELMDGAPVRGESIPIRLFLSPYELTPTNRNINNKFSVKYYLNLVLVDEEDRRYFKQQEITIYRTAETSSLFTKPQTLAVPAHEASTAKSYEPAFFL
ncbi:vacuolar protein sorting-associated protein 26A [Tanacetum coccineum]